MDLIAYVPLFPLLGFLVNGLLAKRLKFSEKLIGGVACATVAMSFLLSAVAVYQFVGYAHDPNIQTRFRAEEARLIESAGGGPPATPAHPAREVEHESTGAHHPVATPFVKTVFEWIPGGGARLSLGKNADQRTAELSVAWNYQLDQLSGLYILFITFVGFWIHVFAVGYMRGETGFARFFAYLNLFMFMMLVLVLGGNFLMMFIGWEGVGLCSYLLIGYYFKKQEAGDASKKAFIVNRVGDFGLTLGVLGVFSVFGTLDFAPVMAMAKAYAVEPFGFASFSLTAGVLTLITLCLFVGATGKSAQIPLFIWLPDAMAGPTPVSALIHAATMVTAGVYMVARCNPLFQRAPTTMLIVAVVGCLTAFVAATIGITQTDIKRVLAYSTVSQLGYMFLGCGVGAFIAGVFHVVTHAFFKAQLFLGSGSVIHGGSPSGHQQEMTHYGNFRKYMPITFKTMTVSLFAICGILPFAGFFSKDEILAKTLHTEVFGRGSMVGPLLYGFAFLTAGVTAFYMTRLMCLTFFGEERWKNGPDFTETHEHADEHKDEHHGHGAKDFHPHESPGVMWVPLVVLAAFAVFSGFFGVAEELTGGRVPNVVHHWLAPVTDTLGRAPEPVHFSATEWVFSLVSMGWALLMMYAAYYCYVLRPELPDKIAASIRPLYTLSFRKWFWDELLDVHFVNGMKQVNDGMWNVDAKAVDGGVNGTAWLTRVSSVVSGWIDRWIVDLLVNLVGWTTRFWSMTLRTMQTGLAQNYMLVMVFGLVLLAFVMEWTTLQNILQALSQTSKLPVEKPMP